MKPTFFNTQLTKAVGVESKMPGLMRFLIENKHCLIDTHTVQNMARQIRTIIKTPVGDFFERLLISGKLTNFAVLNFQNTNTTISELLTTNSLTLDLKQLSGGHVVTSDTDLNNKILVNVTDTLKVDKSSFDADPVITAVDNFQKLFCRGAIVGSYFDADENQVLWLNTYLSEFTMKTYSMILSGMISRYYNLSLPEQNQVGSILAYFIAQQLSVDPSQPLIFKRCSWFGSLADLDFVAQVCKEHTQDGFLTIDKTIEIIAQVSPGRMRNFDRLAFTQICGKLGPDLHTGYFALEYAPYWLYMLLLAFSGSKSPLVFQLTNQNLVKEGRERFLTNLLSAENIFGGVFVR